MKLIGDEAFNEYQELKEKDTPKKPKTMKYEPLVAEGWEYACPRCGCAVGVNKNDHGDKYTDNYEYCDSCGQHLKWR